MFAAKSSQLSSSEKRTVITATGITTNAMSVSAPRGVSGVKTVENTGETMIA
jgi:hypothetical protein